MQLNEVTFLLVDDDDVDVMVLKRAFKLLKIANPVVEASDGAVALDILRGENGHSRLKKPYIVLLDLNMPRMNGIEFLDEIRNDANLRRTVIFVLTTSNDERDKFEAYENHVAGYIVKGDAGETFLQALEMLDRYWRVVELPIE